MLGKLRREPAELRAHARAEAERLFAPAVVCRGVSAALARLVEATPVERPVVSAG
jgi:hypothetical protein